MTASVREPTDRLRPRAERRVVRVRCVEIGGGSPVSVQSMTNVDSCDVEATVTQIERLVRSGCEIVRVAVPHRDAVAALREIRARVDAPLVADVHFDHRLALAAIDAGIDKLRLNPGNIQNADHIARVADAAGTAGIPIRVGANSGSLAKRFLDASGRPTARGLADSALEEVHQLERRGFDRIVVSVKGADVSMTVAANRRVARETDHPIHIGITEAGTAWEGGLRSAVGLGILLTEGIGDTLRVSLTGDPVAEVRTAFAILRSLGLRQRGITWHICPTCGRTRIDLLRLADALQAALDDVLESLTIALMGCSVNGIGEARDADVGVVGGDRRAAVYVEGQQLHHAVGEDALPSLVESEVRALLSRRSIAGQASAGNARSV